MQSNGQTLKSWVFWALNSGSKVLTKPTEFNIYDSGSYTLAPSLQSSLSPLIQLAISAVQNLMYTILVLAIGL
jgi:hypothetical protein